MRTSPQRNPSHLTNTVLACFTAVLFSCGCQQKNDSQNATQTTPDAPETEPKTGSDAPLEPVESQSVAAQVETPFAVATEEESLPVLGSFPDELLSDHEGHQVGRRDLHGRVCVAYLPSAEEDKIPQATESILNRVAEAQEKTPNWPYTAILHLLPTAHKGTDTADEGGDHRLVWNYEGTSDAFRGAIADWQGRVVLIDPVGRVRGIFDPQNSAVQERIITAIDKVWQQQVPFVNEVLHSNWMGARREAQLEQQEQVSVSHDFQFRDVRRKSGIRFLHQVVDDSGIDYKGVHYDHGNGVTIADVDADGKMDIYFVNQLGENKLYKNRGDGTFEDITAASGVAVGDRVCVAASFADIDNDGDADLYVTAVREGNLLFENDGTGKFSDVTVQSGLGYSGHSSGAVFFDFDRDGLLDLFLCNVGQYTTEETGRGGYYVGFKDAFSGHLKPERTELSRLYRNAGGKMFEDVTEQFGMEEKSWTGDAAVWDVNNDGWLDLYVLDMQGNDEYYENQQGKGFVRKSREVFPKTPWGAMGVAVADFDNDLDLDMFITDMHSDMSKDILADIRSEVSMASFFFEEKDKATMKLPQSLLKSEGASIYGNAFFRNDGKAGFSEISTEYNAENYWPWGLSCGDLNADGFEDAFVASSMNYPFRYGVNSVLLNDGKKFHDAEFILGVEPRPGGRTAQPWLTIDCDKTTDELMKKVVEGRTGEITVWGSLGSRSSVMFDYDDDGDLDIITSEFGDMPLILRSDLAQKHDIRFVKVELTGKVSNRSGIGAVLTLHAGDKTLLRSYDGRVGYLSQGIPRLYVGIGEENQVDSIEVAWPNGTKQVFDGPWSPGTTIQLSED